MKTIPPPCPVPESGQKYWRSLDQLANTPEFRKWLEREFPGGASELADPVSRRAFVKLMSASFLFGGLGMLGSGCRRPEAQIVPFSRQPEGYIHGVPQYYATAMPTRAGAIPLVVRSNDGRPTKIEGNPDHPDSNGATDTFAQASILDLYDPDRAQRFAQGGSAISKEKALDQLAGFAARFTQTKGDQVAFLLEQSNSPSRQRLQLALQQKYPQARWAVYEPVDLQAGRAVTGIAPYYKLDQAKVILSLDCDFVGSEADNYRLIRGFSKGRRLQKPTDAMNRLYLVEGLMTLTGFSADHRLRVPTSQVVSVAAAIAAKLAPQDGRLATLAGKLPLPAGVKPAWIEECANDLKANQGASLVLAGYRQPLAVHLIAHLLNTALGNNGKTVFFSEISQAPANTALPELANLLEMGAVETLIILGGNPAYNAPANLNWSAAQKKAKNVIRLAYYEDETAAVSPETTLLIPKLHFLESWGDARTSDGTVVPVQPLIAPLFEGLTELEVLARLGGLDPVKPYDIARGTFRTQAGVTNFEEDWKRFLHDGFWKSGAPKGTDAPLAADVVTAAFDQVRTAAPTMQNLELVFYRDYRMDDGRWNNNGWLQEFPDPVTKITWDGVVLMSRTTAAELGLWTAAHTEERHGETQIVEVEVGGRKILGPVWIQPGFADNSIGLSLGYGRKQTHAGGTGRIGNHVGLYNAYDLRTDEAPYFVTGVKIRRTGQTYKIAVTQEHGSLEGRPVILEANKSEYEAMPEFVKHFGIESEWNYIPKDKAGRPKPIYENPYHAYVERKRMDGVNLEGTHLKSDINQWGMVIDLNSCVGCGACAIACQSENNVPIVGKDQVTRNREMHWLRIDRYYSGSSEKTPEQMIDDPQVVTQPMMCQHCENAPCESVCPVNATVHDSEGLNVMAYNRCVGTRYCSNNCAWKVRRFNFLDYNRRSLAQLKGPFYSSPLVGTTDGEWTLKRWWNNPDVGIRPMDEWNLLKLRENPDVTVRMRGVMEKCTYCVQRIEQGKIRQKVKAGQSGDVRPPDGAIKTACQQVCPAEAIVFGNLLDENSQVSTLKKSDRRYETLAFLDTRPRTSYLARIRNPNPKMPDYHKIPLNIEEYIEEQTENPFEAHPAEPAGHARPAAAEGKGTH
jgi:molybdopterin-containing oxidoreductase family iron-sulfur binding subunit